MKIKVENKNKFILDENVYKTVFENTGSAMVIIDSDTTFLYVNKKFEELSGYSKDELENKISWTKFVIKDELNEILKQHKERRNDEDSALRNYFFKFINKHNEIKYIYITVNMIKGTDKSIASLIDITDKKELEEKMEKLNNVLLSFSNNYSENINKLTQLTGEFFNATCALYNCLKAGNLCSLGTWNTPPNYNPVDKPDGHICYDVIKTNEDILIVNDLQNSKYFNSDPNVKPYALETYIGHIVKCENKPIGSLCVVFQKDFIPDKDSLKLLGIIASAIGKEEEKKKYLERLKESEDRFRTIHDNMPGGTLIVDKNYIIKDVNDVTCEITGYSKEELIGQPCDIVCPKGKKSKECPIWEKGQDRFKGMDTTIKCKDGFKNPILKNARKIVLDDEIHILENFNDISQIKETKNELIKEKNSLNNILDSSVDAIIISNSKGEIIRCNQSACDLFEYKCFELKKLKIYDLYTNKIALKKMSNLIKKEGFVKDYEIRLKKKGGYTFHSSLSVNLLIQDGERQGSVSLIRDLTEKKKIESKLKLLSFQDLLTGTYNRNYFIETMKKLKNVDMDVGLIISDLDGLKFINDALGHDKGDEVIVQTGKILLNSIKPKDILTRIGGDEFAIFIKNADKELVRTIVERIKNNIKFYNQDNEELPLSLSIGYSFGNSKGKGIEKLYKEADHNMLNRKKNNIKSNKNQIMKALMKTLEVRDQITQGHGNRLEKLVIGFGKTLDLDEDLIDKLQLLAKFHDIGKVGISDLILFKEGPLTKEEFEEMKKHCEIGFRIANSIPDLVEIADLIKKHHEKWNGTGYPLGIKEKEIPLESRIISIVDAFDVMTNDRPYKKAISIKEAIQEIEKCSGTQFDPILAQKFIDYLN